MFIKGLSITAIFMIFTVMSSSLRAGDMKMSVKENRFELSNASVKVSNIPGTLRLKLSFPVKRMSLSLASSSKVKLDKITVVKDTEEAKQVKLESKDFVRLGHKARYCLTIETRKDKPFLLFEVGLVNLTDNAINAYFFIQLIPVLSQFYVSANGEEEINSPNIKGGPWIFFPVDNQPSGIGLVYESSRKNLRLGTIFPRKNWKNAGYYFMSNNKRHSPVPIEKNTANKVEFVLFPAKDEEATEQYYQELKKIWQ